MAITSNVSTFLTKVSQGVRPNMYKVDINFPSTVDGADKELVSQLRLLETEHLITGLLHSSMIRT